MTLISFLLLLKFIKEIHNYEITLNDAINDQTELRILINNLNNDYNTKISKKIKEKNDVLKSARKLSDSRDDTIDLFKKGFFPYKGHVFKTKEENKLEKIKGVYKKLFNYIEDESKGISYELFEKHFNFASPTNLAKKII